VTASRKSSLFPRLGLLAPLFFTACATTQIHYVADSATSSRSESRSVVVGGVLTRASIDALPRHESRAIGGLLAKKLDRPRRGWSASPPAVFDRISGGVSNPRRSDLSHLSAFLSPSRIARLRESRFDSILFVLVDGDETWCDETNDISTETETITDKDGKVVACRTITTYTATSRSHREMSAESLLYDIPSGRRIWHASTSHRELHSRSTESTCSCPPPPPHPAPPSRVDVLENIARSIARKITKI